MDSSLYTKHLSQVSRSFALGIAQLQSPEKEYIGLSYILCRLADIIEDSKWPSLAEQKKSYLQFKNFITKKPKENKIQAWIKQIPPSIPETEKELVKDTQIFLADLHNIKGKTRNHIQTCVKDMLNGMLHFSQTSTINGELRLKSTVETNQYCFFVAGIVGELLTQIIMEKYPKIKVSQKILLDSFHFGLYLQKINILKDHAVDISQGRHFIQDYKVLRQSVSLHATHSLAYLQSIPTEATEYRLFCAWSLYLGLASLKYIDQSNAKGKPVKISRIEAMKVFFTIQKIIKDNKKLAIEFKKYIKPVTPNKNNKEAKQSRPGWLKKSYSGKLTDQSIAALGLYTHGDKK